MAGGGGGLRNMLRWPWVTLAETRRGGGGGGILAVVTQSDLSRSHVSWRAGGGGGGGVSLRGGGGVT